MPRQRKSLSNPPARRRNGCQHNVSRQAQNVFLPLLFEGIHITLAQNLLQTLITRRIFFLVTMKLLVVLYQQALLLEVITKVTRLSIVCAFVFIIEAIGIDRRETLK